MLGTILEERYKLVKEIGRGGTSIVYLAKDIQLGRYWAIKSVSIDQNEKFDNAIQKEVELLSGLDHPDIPRIVQLIKTDRYTYVVMDYINGISLDEKLGIEGVQDEEDVILWARGLCQTLHYLHTTKEHPIIYCDLKPRNIMIVNNRPKLIDFGIAKMCDPDNPVCGQSIGTEGYAPPEQYRNGSNILSPSSDIYSMGATMYKLLTNGCLPKHSKPYQPIRKINPNVSEQLEQIIYKCVKNDPAERYQTAKELSEDLEKLRTICHEPRERVLGQIRLTVATLMLAMIFAGVSLWGYQSMNGEKSEQSQQYLSSAVSYEQTGNDNDAIAAYMRSIQSQPGNNDSYQRLYTMMSPDETDGDYVVKEKTKIDYFKNNFKVVNLVNDPILAMLMIQDIVSLQDINYNAYAQKVVEAIKKTPAYKDQTISPIEIEAFERMVMFGNEDLEQFNRELAAYLEQVDQNSELTPNQKVNSYYNALLFYQVNRNQLSQSDMIIREIGDRCERIIESQDGNQNFCFDKKDQLEQIVSNGKQEAHGQQALELPMNEVTGFD